MRYFTDQEINNAIARAPGLIQDEISTAENVAMTIAVLGKQHGLHVDQVGVAAELTRNMLLGLIGPEEFLKDLKEAGIAEVEARGLMSEINKEIFVPLREKLRSGVRTVSQRESGVPQQSVVAPQQPVSQSWPQGVAAEPPRPSFATAPNYIQPRPANSPARQPLPIAPLPPKSILPQTNPSPVQKPIETRRPINPGQGFRSFYTDTANQTASQTPSTPERFTPIATPPVERDAPDLRFSPIPSQSVSIQEVQGTQATSYTSPAYQEQKVVPSTPTPSTSFESAPAQNPIRNPYTVDPYHEPIE